jgi:hypothetical protein
MYGRLRLVVCVQRARLVYGLKEVCIDLDTGCLAEHINLKDEPGAVLCFDDYSLQPEK